VAIIRLDHQEKKVRIAETELEHSLIFKYFDGLPEGKRDEEFRRALQIGVVAMMEDRFAAFLSRTENELGTHLEALKLIYERNVVAKEKTTQSGVDAEHAVYTFLRKFAQEQGYSDGIQETGATRGVLPRNKTGDIVITVDGEPDKTIAVEVKFDASISMGEFGSGDSLSKTRDTAISQLIESNANRGSRLAIIVFDRNRCAEALSKAVGGIKWVPDVGFVVLIDHDRGDYRLLSVAVDLGRSLLKSPVKLLDHSVLEALLERLVRDLATIHETAALVKANHENLKKIASSIKKHALLVGFTQESIKHFIAEGQVSQDRLLALYRGEGIRERFKAIASELDDDFALET
jgi:hypothetical protein